MNFKCCVLLSCTLVFNLTIITTYAAPTVSTHCDQLQSLLNQFRHENKIVGMALYLHSPQYSCYLFSGTIKKNSNQQIKPNNLWQIASITKSYLAALILQLEAESEAGKIPFNFNIEQKLGYWLPQYPAWKNVTIKQLLNMTSGIYSYTDLPISTMVAKDPQKVWRLAEISQLAYQHSPNTYFAPGSAWHYSDTNYILLGQIIKKVYQKATGHKVSLTRILQTQLISPLKLKNTYYYPGGLPDKLLSRMTHGYNYYTQQDFTRFNLSIAGPAGAMIATPKAIAHWILALFNGQALPTKQLKEMTSLVSEQSGKPVATSATTKIPGFGLGLNEQYSKRFGPVWVYEGISSGYTATYFYIPNQQVILVYTANTGSIKKNPIRFAELGQRIFQLLGMPLQ